MRPISDLFLDKIKAGSLLLDSDHHDTVVQFFIFNGEDYLGWDCFHKESVCVGSSKYADLILDGPGEATFYFKGGHLIVSSPGRGVRVNGKPVDACMLGPLDYVTLGPYTLKIKAKSIKNQEEPQISPPSIQEPVVELPIEPAVELPIGPPETEEENEEEDDEEEVGLFSLREKLLEAQSRLVGQLKGEIVIEAVKCRENSVIDVRFLRNKEKYYSEHFCLAKGKGAETGYFFFNDQMCGQILINGSASIDIAELCVPENLYRKRKKIYRYPIPKDGLVCLKNGCYEYLLHHVIQGESPQVAESVKKESYFYKNLAKSLVFHLLIFIFGGFFFSLPKPTSHLPLADEPRFVQIDARQLADAQKKLIQKKPKKIPPKPVQKKAHIKVTKPKGRKVAHKTASAKRLNRTPARSPRAGGGSGHVLNRNIHQAGILSALGLKTSSSRVRPKDALAAVTNLDIVSASSSSAGNFKVAGIVSKVDSGRAVVPSVGLVNTKGSTQVLKSVGGEGKGEIAAMEVGQTGENQVMAMVKAELNSKVRIQGGGMSREAVKKVIDKHLDEITYCYESALVSNPSLMGKIVFEWKILTSGRVGEIRIKSSSVESDTIHACIREKIKSWRFPKPQGTAVIVSYPFIFDIVGF